MLRLLILISFYFVFSSCKNEEKYPGYSRTWDGIYYKFHSIGDSEVKPNYKDFVTIDLLYKTLDDSVFFAGRRTIQITKPDFRGAFDECLLLMSNEDCATFIVNSDNFFNKTLNTRKPNFLKNNNEMKIVVYMMEIMDEQKFNKQKQDFLSWIDDFGQYESKILREFIDEKEISIRPVKSGLYYLKLKDGNGVKPITGDNVTIQFEGRFLNGKYFDSTIKRNQPFDFKIGQEWQVIEGLEEAIKMMTEGEKAIFVIPSKLAFGSEGSSTGIIPPFTSVIFEIELLKISK